MNDFTPRLIGQEDVKKFEEIYSLYELIAERISVMKWESDNLMHQENSTIEDFLKMFEMPVPALTLFLKRKYVELEEISFPGLNMEKIINSDLLELPENFVLIIDLKKEIDNLLKQAKETKFVYQMTKLYGEDGKDVFSLNEEFENSLDKFVNAYTETEEQNEFLDLMERFCDVLSEFMQKGFIRKERSNWVNQMDRFGLAIFNDPKTNELTPVKNIFKIYPFNRLLIKKSDLPEESKTAVPPMNFTIA